MAGSANPYRDWLGLSIEKGKPNYYVLLGVRMFEDDEGRIRDAFQERHRLVEPYKVGPYEEKAQLLVDEFSQAYKCLTNDAAKRRYDDVLRSRIQDRETTSDAAGQTKVLDSVATSTASGIPADSPVEHPVDKPVAALPQAASARILDPLAPPTDAKTTRVDALGRTLAPDAAAIRNSVQLAMVPGVQVIWAIELGEEGLNALCLCSRPNQDLKVVTHVRLNYPFAPDTPFGVAQARENTLQGFLDSYCLRGCQIAVALNLASVDLKWIPIPNGFPPEVSLREFVARRLGLDSTATFQFEVLSIAGAHEATWPNAARVAAAISIDDPDTQQLLRRLKSFEIEPVLVQVGSAALLNLAVREQWNRIPLGRQTNEEVFEVVGFLTVSRTFTRLVLTDGCHTWQKTISFGGEQFLTQFQARGMISTIDARPWVQQIPRDLNPILLRQKWKPDLDRLSSELGQFTHRIRRVAKANILGIRVLDDASCLPWLHAHLADRCGCPIGECGVSTDLWSSLDSMKGLSFGNRAGYFSMCYGAGLQATGQSRLTVNLARADDEPTSGMLRRLDQMAGWARNGMGVRQCLDVSHRSFVLRLAAIGAAICLIVPVLLLLTLRQSSEAVRRIEERSDATSVKATSPASLAESDGQIEAAEEPPPKRVPEAVQEASHATLRTAPFKGLLVGGFADDDVVSVIFAQEELPPARSVGDDGEQHTFALTNIEPRSYVVSVHGCEGAVVTISYSRPGAEVILSLRIDGNTHACCRLYADGTRLVGELMPLDQRYADRLRTSLTACVLELRDEFDNSARLIALYRPLEHRVSTGKQTQRVNLSEWSIPFANDALYLGAGRIQSSAGNAFPFGEDWNSTPPVREWSLADFARESHLAAADIELRASGAQLELVVRQEKRELNIGELTNTRDEAQARVDKLNRWEQMVSENAYDGKWVVELKLLAELLNQPAPEPPPDPTPRPREQDFKHIPPGEHKLQLDRTAFARAKKVYNQERYNRLKLEGDLKEKAEHLVEASRRERARLERIVWEAERALQRLAAEAGDIAPWRELEATLYRTIQVRERQVRIPIGKVLATCMGHGA